MYKPTKIIYNGVATVVFWNDGTKTVVKRAADQQDDKYGAFCAALAIKTYGSNSALKRTIKRGEEGKEQTDKTYLGQAVDCVAVVKDFARKARERAETVKGNNCRCEISPAKDNTPTVTYKKDGTYELQGCWTLEEITRSSQNLQYREAYRKATKSQIGGIF